MSRGWIAAPPAWLVGSLLGAGWVLVGGAYFVPFWSAAGRTPGMQLLQVRVRGASGRVPTPRKIESSGFHGLILDLGRAGILQRPILR